MKKLLVDIGNTSLKWALGDGAEIGPMRVARHFEALPIDVIAGWEQLAGVEQVVVARVGPTSVLHAIETAATAYWRCSVTCVETRAQAHGVRIAYADPTRLGVDRFLALVAAHALAPAPIIEPTSGPSSPRAGRVAAANAARLIVDAGTALTLDALLSDGTHLGGQILPGIATLRASLLQGTRLPPHHTQDHPATWGQDTGPAIAAASLQAPAALTERLYNRLRQQTGAPPRLILTGGDADRLVPLLDLPAEQHPELVLRGLSRFA
jgi:type III pantothenate kinase